MHVSWDVVHPGTSGSHITTVASSPSPLPSVLSHIEKHQEPVYLSSTSLLAGSHRDRRQAPYWYSRLSFFHGLPLEISISKLHSALALLLSGFCDVQFSAKFKLAMKQQPDPRQGAHRSTTMTKAVYCCVWRQR